MVLLFHRQGAVSRLAFTECSRDLARTDPAVDG